MNNFEYVGMGPWKESVVEHDFDTCMNNCKKRWSKNSFGWYIIKMPKDELSSWQTTKRFRIDKCEIVWDEMHKAPTQDKLSYWENTYTPKLLKKRYNK